LAALERKPLCGTGAKRLRARTIVPMLNPKWTNLGRGSGTPTMANENNSFFKQPVAEMLILPGRLFTG
jgi:hypothetical protein